MLIEEVTIVRHAISEMGLYRGDSDLLIESPELELAGRLPSLAKHDYTSIDRLMRAIASRHKFTSNSLHDLFVKKFKTTPDEWVKGKLDETGTKDDVDVEQEVHKFADWAMRRVHLKHPIKINLSHDTQEAQDNHHTGSHVEGSDVVWIYAKNRNLVDILRTVFHEIVHARQSEIGMIKPGDSYPGSPIEVMADALAGKYIKIYGEKNHYIFQ
jgi:hypothetical protein